MSDESRNLLVVTFEDSAEPVKVCVPVCVHACMPAYVHVCDARVRMHVCAHVCESLSSCLVQCRVWEAMKGFG